jgi:hypothetical protein
MNTSPDILRGLASRVCKEEPNRDLDADIAVAVYGGEIVWKTANYTMEQFPVRRYASTMHIGGFGREAVERYTESLDAAASLVPPEWQWTAGWERPRNGGAWADVQPNHVGVSRIRALNPAAALCAAALLALAVEMENKS